MREFKAERQPRPRGFDSFRWPEEEPEIDIEIGAGAGLFAVRYGSAHPSRRLFSIEQTHERFARLKRRVDRHALENVTPVHANAIGWIAHFVPPQSVSRFFLLYPNPYPKASDQNKRWACMPFMGFLLERLKPQGELTIATNEAFYADEASRFMVDHWGVSLKSRRDLTSKDEFIPRTHFERKYLERGGVCFDLQFIKAGKTDRLNSVERSSDRV